MANIKITLDSNESLEEVQEFLIKSLVETDAKEKRYDCPLMNLLQDDLDNIFSDIYRNMASEILAILKE